MGIFDDRKKSKGIPISFKNTIIMSNKKGTTPENAGDNEEKNPKKNTPEENTGNDEKKAPKKGLPKKEFNFNEMKAKLSTTTKYKPDMFLSCGEAFLEASGLPGPAMGHINMLLGHSNAGKTSALIAAAVDAQKRGILPIFLVTEKKWSFDHCKLMGLNCEKNEETGEWDGFFVYRDDFNFVEEVTTFINDCLEKQNKGEIPYDICFFWDSVGSVPCEMTWKGKGGTQHTARVLAEKFNMGLNQKINNSRKETSKYTNGIVICNLPWVALPDNPFGKPKIKPKGGEAIYQCSTLVFIFGNQANSGISKIDATSAGRRINFATKTKVTVDKNHINGLGYADSRLIITPHGFITDDDRDNKKALIKYKEETKEYWAEKLGDNNFILEEYEVQDNNQVDYQD